MRDLRQRLPDRGGSTRSSSARLAAVHSARREAQDPETKSHLLALVDGEEGVWRCHSAWECTRACPQQVDPAEAIMSLRRDLMVHKLKRLVGLE